MWYAASYAEFVSQKIHNVTEEERKGESPHIMLNVHTSLSWLFVVLTCLLFPQCSGSKRRTGLVMSVTVAL